MKINAKTSKHGADQGTLLEVDSWTAINRGCPDSVTSLHRVGSTESSRYLEKPDQPLSVLQTPASIRGQIALIRPEVEDFSPIDVVRNPQSRSFWRLHTHTTSQLVTPPGSKKRARQKSFNDTIQLVMKKPKISKVLSNKQPKGKSDKADPALHFHSSHTTQDRVQKRDYGPSLTTLEKLATFMYQPKLRRRSSNTPSRQISNQRKAKNDETQKTEVAASPISSDYDSLCDDDLEETLVEGISSKDSMNEAPQSCFPKPSYRDVEGTFASRIGEKTEAAMQTASTLPLKVQSNAQPSPLESSIERQPVIFASNTAELATLLDHALEPSLSERTASIADPYDEDSEISDSELLRLDGLLDETAAECQPSIRAVVAQRSNGQRINSQVQQIISDTSGAVPRKVGTDVAQLAITSSDLYANSCFEAIVESGDNINSEMDGYLPTGFKHTPGGYDPFSMITDDEEFEDLIMAGSDTSVNTVSRSYEELRANITKPPSSASCHISLEDLYAIDDDFELELAALDVCNLTRETKAPLTEDEIKIFSDGDESRDKDCYDPNLQYSSPSLLRQEDVVITINSMATIRDHQEECPLARNIFRPRTAVTGPETSPVREVNSMKGSPMPPFVHPRYPALVRDRSVVIGISSKTYLRVCFRIGELLRCANNETAVLELYARQTFSSRESGTSRQHFQFADLFHDRPPFVNGLLLNYRFSEVQETESRELIEERRPGQMVRCLGRVEGSRKAGWFFRILNIRSTDWEEIKRMKELVCL